MMKSLKSILLVLLLTCPWALRAQARPTSRMDKAQQYLDAGQKLLKEKSYAEAAHNFEISLKYFPKGKSATAGLAEARAAMAVAPHVVVITLPAPVIPPQFPQSMWMQLAVLFGLSYAGVLTMSIYWGIRRYTRPPA